MSKFAAFHKKLCFVCIYVLFKVFLCIFGGAPPNLSTFSQLFGLLQLFSKMPLTAGIGTILLQKTGSNIFRYILGTGRWLAFAIYCLLGGLEP